MWTYPRHSGSEQQVPALGPHLLGAWLNDGTVDPTSWDFSSLPVHEYVVRDSASWLQPAASIAQQPGRQAKTCQLHQFIVLMQLQMIRLNDHRSRGSAQDAPRPCLHWSGPSRGTQP